ncbi:MAG: metallophosphoesterase family protein [Sphingobacterium composti]|uniref:metallophosphoesterase family protein n=1 Tax=Sphingobacterium composti TaxID=363260 RepID=UPI00135CAAE7|nr:fibronectin type III domain-containing protein [Sphingobacterium composti Ten et al. 2007 non Yoo et al. 2007]
MKNFQLALILFLIAVQTAFAQTKIYTVIANPGERASNEIRLNWHQDLSNEKSYTTYTELKDKKWKKSKTIEANQEICSVFDSIYSKRPNGEDFYENARFIRNTVSIKGLKPHTTYQYKLISGNMSENDQIIRHFKTAPQSDKWSMGIISDIHVYAPIPNRQKAGMAMLQQLEKQTQKPLDMMLHVGDLSAWGGSYSFWPTLYADSTFSKYVWAGVNGNHDDMTRKHATNNAFFHNVNNNPINGYEGQEGVSYYFVYGNTLFIMLNNEAMKSEQELDKAQQWLRKVINNNPSKYTIVLSHYQWFMGKDGRSSQYTRWKDLFDEVKVDLAISGNNHIYVRTNALYADKETDGNTGTVYIQTPSADNERGQNMGELLYNMDLIKSRWTEGANTVGALILNASKKQLKLSLYDRTGECIDEVIVKAKTKEK